MNVQVCTLYLFDTHFIQCTWHDQQEKPQGHYPAVPPSPRGVKDIMVTQDTSSSLCSERCAEYVWPSKTGGLGQVTTKKKNGYYQTPS